MKKRILSLLLCVTMMAFPVMSFAEDNSLDTACQLSASSISVGDTLYADFKITNNPMGFNNLTGYVHFDPQVLEAIAYTEEEMPNDGIFYGSDYGDTFLFNWNGIPSRVNFVPAQGDKDYEGKADGKTKAGKLGILKFSNYLGANVDGYLQNFTTTGTVLRIKFQAVGNGTSEITFKDFSGSSFNKGLSTSLNISDASDSVTVVGGSTTEATTKVETATQATTTQTTTVKAPATSGGGGGSSSSSNATTIATTEANTETTTKNNEAKTEATTAVTNSNTEKQLFTDVPNDYWGAKYINGLANSKIINGYSDGSFLPNNEIKRADFLLMLIKGVGIDVTKTPSTNFDDVEEGVYYYNAVGLAKAMGIANGNGDGTFSPDSNITRQDMMILAKKALEYKLGHSIKGETSHLIDFKDYGDISSYALESLAAMVDEGLINGVGENSIAPKATTTRAQAATVISKIMDKK